jgi:tRNA(Ile)-lysidine synthase
LKKKAVVRPSPKYILDRVASVIRSHKLINENDRVIVAVSGGADSLALLHILHAIALPINLVAVYIDHGLRPGETPQEQQTIRDHCLTLKTPFEVRPVNVRQLVARGKHSLEEAARILRYRALEVVRQECGAKLIAVGHTADDQVEEFFIRLIRGSSSKGLSGMMTKRDHIIRPLLFENKSLLVDFLSDRGVNWCLDSSNQDRQFLRNRVRLDLLPLLEEKFNPALRNTILQNMDVLSEEDKFLDEQTAESYLLCTELSKLHTEDEKSPYLTIKRNQFLKNHMAIRRRIIEKSCWHMGIRPTYEQICTIIELIESGKNGSELHLEDGVRAEKVGQKLFFSRPLTKGLLRGSSQPAPSIRLSIPGPGTYTIDGSNKELVLEETSETAYCGKNAGELSVDLAKISFPLLLRSFQPGEKFQPCGGPGRKKISRYFNEQKIPPKERPTWPVLHCADRVVAVVGLQLDHYYRISPKTNKILLIRWRDYKG